MIEVEWIGNSLARAFAGKELDIYDVWLILNLLYDPLPRLGLKVDGGKFTLNDTVPTVSVWADKDREELRLNMQILNEKPFSAKFPVQKLNIPVPQVKVKIREEWFITKKGVRWEHASSFEPSAYVEGWYWGNDALTAWIERTPQALYMVVLEGFAKENGGFYAKKAHIVEAHFNEEYVNVILSYPHSEKVKALNVIRELELEEVFKRTKKR